MKDQFASYFEKPEFKRTLAHYEEMLSSGDTRYFEATELTEIAEYYAMNGDSHRAEAALDYALRLHPDNLDALIFKARARLINGHLNEAFNIAETITDQHDREVLFLKAELALANRQHGIASNILRALIEGEGHEAETYADIIDLLVDNKQTDMANDWLEEALTRHPKKQILMESAAYSYVQQERFDEAIELYNQLLDMDAYSTLYWEELGKIHFLREEYDKAIDAFEFAIAINGDSSYYSTYAAANSYFNIGNYERALEYYQRLHEVYPETVDPLFHMGMCSVNGGDDDQAMEYFTQALATVADGSEEQAQIYSQLSLIFSRKAQHEKAISYVDEALKIFPDNTELIIMKGHEMLCQGRYDESTEIFLDALTMNSQHVERSLFLIGVSMLENNYYEMSYHILRLLKENPAIEDELLYPYLCLCEWVLRDSNFKKTLTTSLSISPRKTYEIFNLPVAQGESVDAMIERLNTINQSQSAV